MKIKYFIFLVIASLGGSSFLSLALAAEKTAAIVKPSSKAVKNTALTTKKKQAQSTTAKTAISAPQESGKVNAAAGRRPSVASSSEADTAEISWEAEELWGIETSAEAENITPETVSFAKKRFNFEIGGMLGIMSAITYYGVESRFPLKHIFGPATTSLRVAAGYAQNKDMSRRYLPLQADFIFNFPSGVVTGVENYLGAGLNYTVLTTGRVMGDLGGQVFYGVDSNGFGGTLFCEVGLAMLRTGFSPSQRGVTLLFGYRSDGLF